MITAYALNIDASVKMCLGFYPDLYQGLTFIKIYVFKYITIRSAIYPLFGDVVPSRHERTANRTSILTIRSNKHSEHLIALRILITWKVSMIFKFWLHLPFKRKEMQTLKKTKCSKELIFHRVIVLFLKISTSIKCLSNLTSKVNTNKKLNFTIVFNVKIKFIW